MSGRSLVNAEKIRLLGTASNAAFQRGLTKGAEAVYMKVATKINSTTSSEEYSWLGKWPNIREWIGERVFNQLKAATYAIKNKSYEATVVIDRDDVEDDNVGLYAPAFEEMGQAVFDFPSELVFDLLKKGNTELCYDGQPFFDTDHPVEDENGEIISVSNWGGGTGDLWIVMATGRSLKPIIYQERRAFNNVSLDRPDDPNVFLRKELVYGTDGRMNVGFGFWQFAYASRQPLNAANLKIAYEALENMIGDGGRPLAVKPDLLVTSPTNRVPAQTLLNSELAAGGETNVWKGTLEMLITPWLRG